eukprot:758523-Hanusia_phi.AAC.1
MLAGERAEGGLGEEAWGKLKLLALRMKRWIFPRHGRVDASRLISIKTMSADGSEVEASESYLPWSS